MSMADLNAILPLIILAGATGLLVVQMSLRRSHVTALVITVVGLALSFRSLFMVHDDIPYSLNGLLIMDAYALLFSGLIMVVAAVVSLMVFSYLLRRREHREEMYILILIATIGSIVLTAANHFVTFILGLETLTIPLYVMIGYLRHEQLSLEAGIKYLILAATSSAFLLFGMGLIYAELGSMEFAVLAERMSVILPFKDLVVLAGTALVIVGAGFKLGVVPFHMWTPDVYQGAPAPVTAYIATVSKTAMAALLLRYVIELDLYTNSHVVLLLSAISIASMLVGNLLALLQSNLKRLLAYSSIAHLGYLLVAIISGGEAAVEATIFYMMAYSVTTLGAFGIIAFVSGADEELTVIETYRGLFWRRPALAVVFSVMLLSLAGIPLTAGFIGKFLLIGAGVGAAKWVLVLVLVLGSAIGLYYYLRVMAVMLSSKQQTSEAPLLQSPAVIGSLVLVFLTAAVIYLGISPGSVLSAIRDTLGDFPY